DKGVPAGGRGGGGGRRGRDPGGRQAGAGEGGPAAGAAGGQPGPRAGPAMTTRITDSALYGHLWGTAEARAVLGEQGRLRGWLEVLAALARAQAAAGVIPPDAAALISESALSRVDLAYAAEQTRQSSHSMLGLIRALQQVLPPAAREYVYVGATVQDITDTATAVSQRRIGGIAW